MFHSLLKAHALEARSIVRQALEILTPVVPIRMEDANVSVPHDMAQDDAHVYCVGHTGPLD